MRGIGKSEAAMVGPALVVQVLIVIYPMLLAVIASLQNLYLLTPTSVRFVGLKNYLTMARDPLVLHALALTGLFIVGSTVATTVLGIVVGLLLSSRVRGINLFRGLFLIPMMITPAVTALLWAQLWHTRYGAINSLLGGFGIKPVNWLGNPYIAPFAMVATDVWQWTPFVALIVLAGFQSLPSEIFEAAHVDGVNNWQRFWRITLPLLMPFLGTVVLFRIVYGLRAYEIVWLQTMGGPGSTTELMSVRVAIKAFTDLKIGQSSALAIMLLVLVTVFTTILYRLAFARRQG